MAGSTRVLLTGLLRVATVLTSDKMQLLVRVRFAAPRRLRRTHPLGSPVELRPGRLPRRSLHKSRGWSED